MFYCFCFRATMSLFQVQPLIERVRAYVNGRLGLGRTAFAAEHSEEHQSFLEELNQGIDDGSFADSTEGITCRIVFPITPLPNVTCNIDNNVESPSPSLSSSSSSTTEASKNKRKQSLVPKIEPEDDSGTSFSSSSSLMPPPPAPPLKRKMEVVIISDDTDDENEVEPVEKKMKKKANTSSSEPMPSTSQQVVTSTSDMSDDEVANIMACCDEEWVWDDFLGNQPPQK